VSFHRQIGISASADLLPNLAEFCSNYGVEYTKAVYKLAAWAKDGFKPQYEFPAPKFGHISVA
jgi:hypothetical protein